MSSDSDNDDVYDSAEERDNELYEEMGHEKTTCTKCKKLFYPETYDNNEICRKCRAKFYIKVTYKEKTKYHDGYCSDPEYHKTNRPVIKYHPVPSDFVVDDFDNNGNVVNHKWNKFNLQRKTGCCLGYTKYKVKSAQLVYRDDYYIADVPARDNLFERCEDSD